MSARKPLARMDSPAITEYLEEVFRPLASDVASTENNGNTAVSTTEEMEQPQQLNKEETRYSEEMESKESLVQGSPTTSSGTEAKKITRNSPMLVASHTDSSALGATTSSGTEGKRSARNSPMLVQSQTDSLAQGATTSSGTEAKRLSRNSPMLVASPLKKKISDSQEQDSSAESTTTTDEAPKKNEKSLAARFRKLSDTSNKSSSKTTPPTNRMTRKAAAKDWAANTRLTRARRASGGIGAKPETPQKRKYVFKKNIDPQATAVKRKRSVSPKPNPEEPEIKITKSEDQDEDFEINSVTIKQEIMESSEEMASDVASDITESIPAEPTSRISLRARKAAMSYSPTTRPYRRDKDKEKLNAEATTSDGRRKRLSRMRGDEDSKDSLGSSIIEDLVDVKVEEKFSSEDTNEGIFTQKIETIPPASSIETTNDKSLPTSTTDSIDTPLIVITTDTKPQETQVASTSASAASEQSNSSDKAASLSPELVSEGVSEISVKRFYKKPEFLENNLGIENDPKLGEIVQNVAEKMDDTVDGTSVSNESIKEGELVFEEEEDDEVTSIGSIKNDHDENDDEVNSVSTGFISPLLVEEEEEDEEEEVEEEGKLRVLNGDEKVEEISNEVHVLQYSGEEKNGVELEEDEVEKVSVEVPSGNGSVEENVESKSEDGVKSEFCDREVISDIEKKESSKNEDDFEEKKENEILKTTMEKDVENKKEIVEPKKEEVIENMEVDDLKIEENKDKIEEPKIEEKILTDQEENKENVELGIEALKEGTQEVRKTPEKESTASMSTDDQEETHSESSKTTSPNKTQGESSGEATTPSTSPQSSKSSSVPRTPENDERLRQKERHLKTLGLLTHKAADEAIMAKQKRRKFLHNLNSNSGSKKNANTNAAANAGSAAGNAQNKSSQEYTGTLKTVIKLNRQSGGGAAAANEPKRGKNVESGTKAATSGCGSRRQSLKMTFQKGRGRPPNTEKHGEHPINTSGEDSYYTIQNEGEGATTSGTTTTGETHNTATTTTTTTAHGRKSYNRSNTTDASHHHTEHHEVAASSKKDEKEEILIPEKASSFKFHPGRLCQDQCYYCSGKFGLYDTPCHVGQIKSVERQQKILANEEKLTVDNCLCDACFRHVDRRANVPSYKKRLSAPGNMETVTTNTSADDTSSEQEKPPPAKSQQQSYANGTAAMSSHTCAVPDCDRKAAHSLRRKGIRKSVKKSLLNFDMSTAGTYLHICDKHYEAVVQSSGCVLCKRRLGKNNMYHITTDTDRLEKALAAMGIPVTLGQGTAVCKLCRYFANLLMKPPEHGKVQKVEFVKNYRKRLLQFYNIHEKKENSHADDEEDKDKEKPACTKKQKTTAANSKRVTRKSRTSNEAEEEEEEEKKEAPPKELPTQAPPSPTHSTGSSVEMISDGEEDPQPIVKTPSVPATAAAPSASTPSNQMVLDNDVMVDYDVPTISDSSSSASSKSSSPPPQRNKHTKDQQSKLKAILQSVGTSLEDRHDMATVLRSNPNISMRELFPGEEDLGLQFKAPFGGSSSQRTPEGWTRINTFLQYDEPTRRLWEDLQKPYGNQSSFLRHLILLEKYYRNGDLILSSNASSNATVYTQTVRNRLTSYDSRSSSSSSSPSKELERRSRSLSVDKIQRQLSSNSVTITARPKEPKPQQKESGESNKQKDGANSSSTSRVLGGGAAAAPPPPPPAGAATTATSTPNSRSILKSNLIGVKGSAIEIVPLSAANSTSNSPHSSSGSSTPTNTSLLTKQQKILAAANKLMSNKLEASPHQKKTSLNTTPPELISLNRRPVPALTTQQMKRPQLLPKPIPPNVIVLPDTLTSQERLESKSWRPTLLPVTASSHHLNNQQGPLYQTADGRRLPALVQVQSGGRPFLISIHDYNRMCILRREKLMRDQMLKGNKGKLKGGIVPPPSCIPNNSGKLATNSSTLQSFNKTMQAIAAAENAAKKQRFIMSKTNYAPIAPKPATQTSTATLTTSTPSTSTSQQQTQQSQPTMILPAGTLQPISLLSSTQSSALSILPNFAGQVLPILNPSTSTAGPTATAISGVPTNSWLWNNFPDSSQMLMNGKATTKGPQPTTSMKQQSLLLDNSLMSKIPKSLTVIPQHKLMPAPSSGGSGNISKD